MSEEWLGISNDLHNKKVIRQEKLHKEEEARQDRIRKTEEYCMEKKRIAEEEKRRAERKAELETGKMETGKPRALEQNPAQIVDSLYRWVNIIIGDEAQWILNLNKEAYRNRCRPDARKFWDSHNKEVVSLKEMRNQIDTYYESSGHPGRGISFQWGT